MRHSILSLIATVALLTGAAVPSSFAQTRILTVDSSNPDSGVSITVNPNDNNGQGDGPTQFTRTYDNNTVVSLTAPATAGGNNFLRWRRDGVDWTSTQSINVTMGSDYTMTAVYALSATIIFVEPSGLCNGNTPCFSSIQQAIDATDEGATITTIKVAQGTYHENMFFDTSLNIRLEGGWTSDFSTRAADPALTIIDGDTDGDGIGDDYVMLFWAVYGASVNTEIDRFTIQNGSGAGILADAFYQSTIDLLLTGNVFRNNRGGAFAVDSADASVAQATLINNVIHDNEGHFGGGVSAYSTVISTTIINIVNSTIANNSAEVGGGVYVYSEGVPDGEGLTNVILKNTIVWNNSATTNGDDIGIKNINGIAVVDASFSDIGEVFIDPNWPGIYNDLGNNIDLDPLFVDPSGGDFRLGTGSPAIDAGTADGAPDADFEGEARPQGEEHDMGADEFTPLTVLTAKAGDVWDIGTTQTIAWLAGKGKVQIQISRDGGRWKNLGNPSANDGFRDWKVTKPATGQARIRVCKVGKKLKCGPSSPEFTIQ